MAQLNSKKTVMKNTAILYVRMVVTLLVSLYTSRVTLELLGIDDFGVYGVVGSVVGLFGFLTNTLTASFNRFLCIGIAHDDTVEMRRVIGASIIIQLIIIAGVLLLCETVGIWFINNHLVIAPEKLMVAHIVFQFSIATFIINIFRSAYNCIVISFEKMTIYAYLCIFEVLAKLGVVFALALFSSERLAYYAALIFIVQALLLLVYMIYVRKVFPELSADIKGCRPYVGRMLSFAGYGFIGSFAFVAKNQCLNFILNIFGGPVLNAARSISFQVYTAVYNFVSNFQTAFSPYILKHQEVDNDTTCNRDVALFTHLSFAVMAVLMIPIIFETSPILHLWLGDNVPEYTAIFTQIILLIGMCEAISSPLQNIIYGKGDIKALQIISFVAQFAVVGLSYAMLRHGAIPAWAYYVDLAINILLVVARILIAAHFTGLKIRYYLVNTFLPIAIVSAFVSLLYAGQESLGINQLLLIAIAEGGIGVYAVSVLPKGVFLAIKTRFIK